MATGIPSFKVILHGEYGVGKSSIFRRFMNDTFTQATGKQSTIGLDQCTRTIDLGSQNVKLTLWDTGGMERMSFIGSSYYRGAHAALLCYSVNNKDTFSILSQYILDIVMNAEGAKIFLCGNMTDQLGPEGSEGNAVTDTDLDQFMSQCQDVLSGVYRVSCKDSSGLEEMFRDMARVLHQDTMSRMTMRRDMIRPGDTPEREQTTEKKRCC
ncbi:GTP-binding protein ypt1 [Aplysia californica]|uniref:GTP-binding protein ypt1 n=1 Tax=Aplysia californica TaxID=6500 RepID=A0ABM0JL81_APLCA|nr:GTP-binding protein ypt1 [Aplysia californica]XP_005096326.1 GTP-binding protein ypt1 [Aplysia californica]XP_005096327.1 GTP-binding protein ypt1 [Aplysia californica]XP_035825082.1 GTP-binding protein ypt1 [Aplysia californica]